MPQSLSDGQRARISRSSVRTCRIWDITRTDGVVLRFTDHDRPFDFEGNDYDPTDGLSASASQSFQGFKESNVELVGILSSTKITDSDLRAGKYRDARILQRTVDWLYPWMGAIDSRVFWIGSTTRVAGESWTADTLGVQSWLSKSAGTIVGRSCINNLGDERCNADGKTDLSSGQGWLQEGKTVATVVVSRRSFRSDLSAAVAKNITGINDAWYTRGVLTFTTGLNAGLAFEIQTYTETNGEITLRLPTPFDVAVSDQFMAHPGCGKSSNICITKFANLTAFGGDIFIPGADDASETP